MSTHNQIKVLSLICGFLFMTMIGFVSCDSNNKYKDSEDSAKEMNKPDADYTKETDERFLVRAAEINFEEIQLSQLAQQRGTIQEVKDLGKLLEDAHTKANNSLGALASQKGIAIPRVPTQDAQDAYNKLSEKSGNEFDREYCERMVSGHKDAIDLYDSATRGNNDPDIKTWAMNMLPDLRVHLAKAQSCEDKIKQLADKTQ